MMSTALELAVLEGKRYLSLETYRKSGTGVRTPVWFAVEPTNAPASNPRKLYVYTVTDSGKAKPIRQNGVVKIAPCDARGNVSGKWIDAHAEIVSGDAAVCGLSTANTVRGSRSSIYSHYCFAVMNASCSRSGQCLRGQTHLDRRRRRSADGDAAGEQASKPSGAR
jgi:PPOX class probable F420-dependent enzyme